MKSEWQRNILDRFCHEHLLDENPRLTRRKTEYRAKSEDRGALMLCCRQFEELTDVRLLKPVSIDAFAGHPRAALTTSFSLQARLG